MSKYAAPLERVAYSVVEAATQLRVSRATAYRLVQSGELRSVRLRGRVVIPVEAVTELLGKAS